MGGSGGGGYFQPSETPQSVKESLRREEQNTANQIFEAEVSEKIGDLLVEYNTRDEAKTRRLLESIRQRLASEFEDTSISPVFGGSVRKHTYVDGISDIDALLVFKDQELCKKGPGAVLDRFEDEVKRRFPDADVDRDKMSVTVKAGDVTLQLLPAVRKHAGLLIPSESGDEWSKIRPETFFNKLSEVNEHNGKKVVPAIKIIKGINNTFPDGEKLSGYHIESLAIQAFRDYDGPQNTKAMIERFFDVAKAEVLSPIKDSTGQSVHVDEYAGPRRSEKRRAMAQNLDRISRRIKNANAIQSSRKWLRIINGEEE